MQIRVRLFATLRQLAGWAHQTLDLPEDATVADALAELDRRCPQLTVTTRTIYVAVNQEYAKTTQPLHAGDELALFPPVSGG
jgi:molybdopterin converting factor subunit 1